jgi:hypothetical protein
MPNNKDNMKTGSHGSTGNKPDREFESQGQNPSSDKSGQQAGSYGKGSGSHGKMDDDDMTTSGGRKGNFSEKNRDSESQWSPGSTQSSDQ